MVCEKESYNEALSQGVGILPRISASRFFFDLFNFPKRGERSNEIDEYTRSDSPWGFIGGVMQYFHMSYDEVVFKRSYINILLLNSSIPSVKPSDVDRDEEESEEDETIHNRPIKRRAVKKEEQMNPNQFFMNFM